jgi:peptidoglycan/LPS O-acetylase OafA/YrhL
LKYFAKYFELQDPENSRWLAMEGLRGIAILLVFFVHYSTLIEPYVGPITRDLWWIWALRDLGNSGVDLFFVLSGFLIYKVCIQNPIKYGKYTYRRIERIYPTFLAVLALYLVLSVLFPEKSKLPSAASDAIPYILANVMLLPGMFDITAIITVAWSLSYEAFFYIVAPTSVALLAMRKWGYGQRIAFFVFLYVVLVAAEWANLPLHFRLSMFLGGMVLYEMAFRGGRTATQAADMAWLDGVAVVLFLGSLFCFTLLGRSYWMIEGTLLGEFPSFFKYILLNLSIVLLVHRCLFSSSLASNIFSWTPLRWLGNMSYTYYLLHGLGLQAFFLVLTKIWQPPAESIPPTLVYLLLLAPAFVASVLAALPVYLLVERPISLKPKYYPALAQENVRKGS